MVWPAGKSDANLIQIFSEALASPQDCTLFQLRILFDPVTKTQGWRTKRWFKLDGSVQGHVTGTYSLQLSFSNPYSSVLVTVTRKEEINCATVGPEPAALVLNSRPSASNIHGPWSEIFKSEFVRPAPLEQHKSARAWDEWLPADQTHTKMHRSAAHWGLPWANSLPRTIERWVDSL